MTNNGSSFSLCSSRATFLLLFVLLQATAGSAFQQPATRLAGGGAHHPRAMTIMATSSCGTTTSLKVSTMAGDWDMTEEEETTNRDRQQQQQQQQQERASSLLQQHRQLQLRAAAAAQAKREAGRPAPPSSLAPELELPRHSVVAAAREQHPVATAERMLGRVSMVAAFILVANEFVTGQSLPDQIVSVLTVVLSN